MGIGFLIMWGGIWNMILWPIGFGVIWIGPILQHRRIKRLKRVQDDPLRCECGGHFVPPWDLGFDDIGVLICDNENGLGPLGACVKWIEDPKNYATLQNIGDSETQ